LDVTIIEQQCGPQLSILNIPVQTRDISFSATVGDLELFKTAWLNGIGRDKTYGFGMIRLDGTLFTPPCNNSAHA
jgi:CRISPR/Cas system endoribonuclease Cas6 (RAMP superfamily)